MCARRRSNFLLRRQEKVTKEKATPLSVTVFGVRVPIHRAYGSPKGAVLRTAVKWDSDPIHGRPRFAKPRLSMMLFSKVSGLLPYIRTLLGHFQPCP